MGYTVDSNGIYRNSISVQHREDEYSESGFETLMSMQKRHFWYRGRHRFLLSAVDRFLPAVSNSNRSAVDLGGGVGGWMHYLHDHRANLFKSIALADSSEVALRMAENILPSEIARFQVDLMNLCWKEEWDVAFLLDVIEHLPNDLQALREVYKALKPGGLLFVTAPAFPQFWSYNDEVARHLRRYIRKDFTRLAKQSGLQLVDARYFMFLLSPLYWLTRRQKRVELMSEEKKQNLAMRAHQVPAWPINASLTCIFSLESTLSRWMKFPWGTSILGVFRKL